MEWQIHGHEWAVSLLKTHASGDKRRHAYLLVGPEGVGRRTLALKFSQALLCSNPPGPGQFCGICRHCRQLQSMQHPDLSLLVPEEGHKDILIDQVRELQHSLALSPYSAKFRIALLLDFQRATNQAMNALLKTLEEPQDKVILLLTANNLESLLPTIVSRCEVIRMRPASIASTQSFLEIEKGLSGEQANLLAHLSGGRVGAAIHMAEDSAYLSRRRENMLAFLAVLPAPRYQRFQLADKIAKPYDKARVNLGEVLPLWLSFWRDVFICTSHADLPLVNIDYEAQVSKVAANLDELSARHLVVIHEKAIKELDLYANPRLLAETLMLQWPHVSVLLPLSE